MNNSVRLHLTSYAGFFQANSSNIEIINEILEKISNWKNQFNIELEVLFSKSNNIEDVLLIRSYEYFYLEMNIDKGMFSYSIPVKKGKIFVGENFNSNDILELQNKCQLYSILVYNCINVLSNHEPVKENPELNFKKYAGIELARELAMSRLSDLDSALRKDQERRETVNGRKHKCKITK